MRTSDSNRHAIQIAHRGNIMENLYRHIARRFKSLAYHDLRDMVFFVFSGKMKDFQRDLDREHVPHDSHHEARAHVSDAIQIATPAHVRPTVGSDG